MMTSSSQLSWSFLPPSQNTNSASNGRNKQSHTGRRIRCGHACVKTCHGGYLKFATRDQTKFLERCLQCRHVDPSEHFLAWNNAALNVLVIKKVMDPEVTKCFKELTQWLVEEKNMVVFAEETAVDDPVVLQDENFSAVRSKLYIFKEGDQLDDKIDFIVCMGGDGTLLHASSLFQVSCPPVMAFHLGSLGFLTAFRFQDFRTKITTILEGHAGLTLRSRLQCDFFKRDKEDKSLSKKSRYLVLNEVVVDRGPSSYLTNLDIYCNDIHITSVQGDGLIVSTPTGSTAYAVAAGASMVHPSVAAILVTPVCPHSLSFRPIILPAGVELKIVVSQDARSSAWTSFDGRNRQELDIGDSIHITTSIYPVPCVNSENQITDWFKSLAECLHWNVRQRQRQLSTESDN
ncbi:NAD kinase-like isoform X2 [Acropora muricata]|uniref:NAD kinase-like isoform X2 n=1 Tax=Acropora millepora TaxID=45264 RepID=UPI0010FCCF67|nr:NAD kinase-like isoform X2 [Acropora millepora]